MPIVDAEGMKALIGTESVSDWVEVTQDMIDRFADATGDHQFIHVDPVAAAATPFEGTVAHGFLTLSLMPLLMGKVADPPRLAGLRIGLNYGGNSVRFIAPVRAGSRLRGRFRLVAFEEKQPGRFQHVVEYTAEVEGGTKPALVAEWITQFIVG